MGANAAALLAKAQAEAKAEKGRADKLEAQLSAEAKVSEALREKASASRKALKQAEQEASDLKRELDRAGRKASGGVVAAGGKVSEITLKKAAEKAAKEAEKATEKEVARAAATAAAAAREECAAEAEQLRAEMRELKEKFDRKLEEHAAAARVFSGASRTAAGEHGGLPLASSSCRVVVAAPIAEEEGGGEAEEAPWQEEEPAAPPKPPALSFAEVAASPPKAPMLATTGVAVNNDENARCRKVTFKSPTMGSPKPLGPSQAGNVTGGCFDVDVCAGGNNKQPGGTPNKRAMHAGSTPKKEPLTKEQELAAKLERFQQDRNRITQEKDERAKRSLAPLTSSSSSSGRRASLAVGGAASSFGRVTVTDSKKHTALRNGPLRVTSGGSGSGASDPKGNNMRRQSMSSRWH